MREILFFVFLAAVWLLAAAASNPPNSGKDIAKLELEKAKLQAAYSKEAYKMLEDSEGAVPAEKIRAAKLQMDKDAIEVKIAEIKAR